MKRTSGLISLLCMFAGACGGGLSGAPGGAAQTARRLAMARFSAADTADALQNTATFALQLNAGETVLIGTCGLVGASYEGDTYLRLLWQGDEVAENDDGCAGLGSQIAFTPTVSGTYELHAGCFDDSECSGVIAMARRKGVFEFSTINTNNATINTFNTTTMFFNAGEIVMMGTCGLPGSSFQNDTYLRLFRVLDEQLMTVNDDACGGLGSQALYVVEQAGGYQVRAGCYSNSSCAGTLEVYVQ